MNDIPEYAIKSWAEMNSYLEKKIYLWMPGVVHQRYYDGELKSITPLTLLKIELEIPDEHDLAKYKHIFGVTVLENVNAWRKNTIYVDPDWGVRWGDDDPRGFFFQNYWHAWGHKVRMEQNG
jgi:hypothetical protein